MNHAFARDGRDSGYGALDGIERMFGGFGESPELEWCVASGSRLEHRARFRKQGRDGRPEGFEERRWSRARGESLRTGERWGGERRRGARLRLPDVVRIDQSAEGLTFVDSLGAPVVEIRTGRKPAQSVDLPALEGTWRGDRLEVVQNNPRGGQVTQTYHLAEDGRTLEIRMHMQCPGDATVREFVRVYRRQGA